MMIWNTIKRFVRDEEGLETVEWAVVGTAIVIAAIAAFQQLGTNTSSAMQNIADQIPGGGTPTPGS